MARNQSKPVGTMVIEGDMSVHVVKADAEFAVWLDPDGAPKTGVCIGVGKTSDTAISDARKTLLRALAETEGWDGLS